MKRFLFPRIILEYVVKEADTGIPPDSWADGRSATSIITTLCESNIIGNFVYASSHDRINFPKYTFFILYESFFGPVLKLS